MSPYYEETAKGMSQSAGMATPAKQKEIPEMLVNLERTLDRLHEAIGDLEMRLSTVSHETKSQVGGVNPRPPNNLTPLASAIDADCARVMYARERITLLAESLEL
ncbi:MAG: hypothetical protein ACHQUC_09250 [Chlamydiales bacterium]